MVAAYGEQRAHDILGLTRHNTVYFPNLTIKGAIQAIRVVKPLAVDKTLIESWTFRLKGAPPELLRRTAMYTRLINSPFSVVGHDDLHAYRGIQEGLRASGNDWVSLHRNFDPAEVGPEGPDGQRHERDLDAQPVPRLGEVHDAGHVREAAMITAHDVTAEQLIELVLHEARLLDERATTTGTSSSPTTPSTGCRWSTTSPTASTTPRTCTRTSCCASCASSG